MQTPVQSCDLEIRVRYAEVDRMGVLHHSRYWEYFEMGRTELLRQNGAVYRELEARGVFFVVARCSARFSAPARYDDVLRLTSRVVKIGQAKINHAYELRRVNNSGEPELLATAETTLACVSGEGQIIPIPDFMRVP
ncbi:MAG: thioesterase family protein [Planctomycetota bacterium]|nr:thioesterase family protein [Planctomycetota bacterium]